MQLIFHPAAYSDLEQIADYYESVVGKDLADDFFEELKSCIFYALRNPQIYLKQPNGLRRVNLSRFPYHFFFLLTEDSIRILVVRHHHRDPSYGMDRR